MLQRCLSWISLCVIYWNLLETVRGKAIREDVSAQPFEEVSVFLDDDDVIHYTVENDPAVTVKTNAEDESEETDHQVLRRVKQIDVETNTISYDDTVLNEIVVSGNAATEAEGTSSSSSEEEEEEKDGSGLDSFVSWLLAEADPQLVKVLLDNSEPENLEVFLKDTNITIRELRDFVNF